MTINLKTTIIASTLLAVSLNIVQFFGGLVQHKDAFSPSWAYAASAPATPMPSTAPPALPLMQPAGAAPAAALTSTVTSPTEQPADTKAIRRPTAKTIEIRMALLAY